MIATTTDIDAIMMIGSNDSDGLFAAVGVDIVSGSYGLTT